jgi:hypothetical protein
MRGTRGIVGVLVAALVSLLGVEAASAATLKADYRLQGDRKSDIAGAPKLVDLGTGNRFAIETSDGVARRSLAFQQGSGLSLPIQGLVHHGNHSVAMSFRLGDVSGYRRILDFTSGTSDNGFYNLQGRAVLYVNGIAAASPGVVFDDHSYAHLVLTSGATEGGSQTIAVYVNGRRVAAARTSTGFGLASRALRFFKDNMSGPGVGEEAAGAVDCIRVYDGTLTARQVRRVASDSKRCAASRSRPRRADALVTGRPRATQLDPMVAVDTGLTVRCPVGTTRCRASVRVDVAPPRGRGRASGKHLGSVRFPVSAGESTSVEIPLSPHGGDALRKAGKLRIRASARIVTAGGGRAAARQTTGLEAPKPRTFEVGTYTGLTSQGLPVSLEVGETAVEFFHFRWRALCADGQTHTNGIFLGESEPFVGGRFSYDRILNTGARARVSGELEGKQASGTLSRSGGSAFGTDCLAEGITWQAHLSNPPAPSSP